MTPSKGWQLHLVRAPSPAVYPGLVSCTLQACRSCRKQDCLVSDPHRAWECLCTLPVASISRGQCFRGVARVSQGGEACCPHTRLFCGVSLRLMGACVSLSSPSPSHFREHLTLWLRVCPKMSQTCPGTSALPRCSPGRAGARHCMGWGAGGLSGRQGSGQPRGQVGTV